MVGFILAAGFGTRLRPLTDHLPKALVPICGVPLLARNLRFLQTHGVGPIGVNAHYLPEQMVEFEKRWPGGFTLFHEQGEIRGTGGGIHFARDFLASDDSFCVCNVDILSNVDLTAAVATFNRTDCIAMLIAAAPAVPGGGTIAYAADSTEYRGVTAGRPADPTALRAEFIGMALYRREFLSFLTQSDFSIIPVWQRCQQRGHSVRVLVAPDIVWHDAGTAAAVARIHFDQLDGRIALDTMGNMVVDRQKKAAWPQGLPARAAQGLGAYTWSDSARIHPSAVLHDCVVLDNVEVGPGEAHSHCILTPWGVIPTNGNG
jgi:NDP-sugar pyrophosphorylase family protein